MNGLRVIKGGRSWGSLSKRAPKVRSFGIPKALGERLEPKNAHLVSEAHLSLVRAQPCIVTGKRFYHFERGGQLFMANVVAHHPDELFPEQVGQQKKCSDYLAVPIMAHLHEPKMPGSLHHHGGASWWKQWAIDPYAWLEGFLLRHYPAAHEGAAYALGLVRGRGRYVNDREAT